jgi:hypothetical protein
MMNHEEQQISAMMHFEIVQNGVDTFFVFWDGFIYRAEEVYKVYSAATRVALCPALPCGLPQGSINVTKRSAPIVDLLLGSLGWASIHIDGFLARIALG